MSFVMLSDVWIFWTNFKLRKRSKARQRETQALHILVIWFAIFWSLCSLLSWLPFISLPWTPQGDSSHVSLCWAKKLRRKVPPREEDNSSSTLLQRNVFEEFQISLSSQPIYLCHLYYLSWFNPRSKICTKQTENCWAHKKQWEGITFIVQPEQIRGWSRGMLWELNQPQSANYPRNNFRCSWCKCLVLLVFGFCTGNLLTLGK